MKTRFNQKKKRIKEKCRIQTLLLLICERFTFHMNKEEEVREDEEEKKEEDEEEEEKEEEKVVDEEQKEKLGRDDIEEGRLRVRE